MKLYIFVATEEEKQTLIPEYYWSATHITGIGISRTLCELHKYTFDKDDIVVNVGLAGAKGIKKGTVCNVVENELYHENYDFYSKFILGSRQTSLKDYKCYTATDFILNSGIDGPFLVDMELASYNWMPCKVYSIKVVSDNLDINDYFDEALKKDYTNEIDKELWLIQKGNKV